MVSVPILKTSKYIELAEKTKFLFLNKIDMNYNDVYRFGKGLHRICMLPKPFEVPMKCV